MNEIDTKALKMKCLELAIKNCPKKDPQSVDAAARKFYAFVSGEKGE